jgi:hypothetical protein
LGIGGSAHAHRIIANFPRREEKAAQSGVSFAIALRCELPPSAEGELAMVAVNYLWNPINDNIVREFDDAGNTIAEYTTEPDLYGNVVSQYRNGQTSYLLSDGQGNTTELTNDAGNVTDTIRHSAFGEISERTGNTELPFQYVGQKGYYQDEDTWAFDVRRRSYIACISRWTSTEPQGDGWKEINDLEASSLPLIAVPSHVLSRGRGSNRQYAYRYCDNDPVQLQDPSGLSPYLCLIEFILLPERPKPPVPPPPNAKGKTPCTTVRTKATISKTGDPLCFARQHTVLETIVEIVNGKRVTKSTWWCVECQDFVGTCKVKQECSLALKTVGTAAPIHVCVCLP